MKSILLFAVAAAGLFLSSCETTAGFGRDLRTLGSGVERSSYQAREPKTQAPAPQYGAPAY